MHLIPEWREVWKFYSTWAVAALTAWNMVPMILQTYIPLGINVGVSVFLLASFIIVRVIGQPKIKKAAQHED